MLTVGMGTQDNAVSMAIQGYDFSIVVESRFPGLIARIHEIIRESESKHKGSRSSSESFLWEHTMHATSIAYQLALAEHLDPLLPVIAALFHDAGKFADGRYHGDEMAEEEKSARIAGDLLRQFGMKHAEIRQVLAGLKALFTEKSRKNTVAAILHDADFLSKFGALGVAGFFIKSALRRRTLRSTVLGYLGKELTYASCLPLNMHTAAGRRLAAKKASDTLKFFRALLAELRDSGIADLRIRQIHIPHPAEADRILKVRLVVSPACPKCGCGWSLSWTIEKGIKCRRLTIEWTCSECGEQLETSFCLPEIAY